MSRCGQRRGTAVAWLIAAAMMVGSPRWAFAHDAPTIVVRFETNGTELVTVTQVVGPEVLASFTLPASCHPEASGASHTVTLQRDRPTLLRCAPGWTHDAFAFQGLGTHVHAVVAHLAGPEPVTRTVYPVNPTLRFDDGAAPEADLAASLRAGAHHVATGLDHLALVALLVVAASRLTDALLAMLGFTFAHGLTLGFAAFGHPAIPSRLAELLVAASLFLAGFLPKDEALATRTATAFAFGLVHGVAFLEGLAPLLAATRAPLATLAAFHVGIEAVQLAVALALAAAFAVLAKRPAGDSAARALVRVLAGAYGVALFLARIA